MSNNSLFNTNIEHETINNQYFRKVIFTGKHMQLVLMSLKIGENIPKEIHKNVDQFFRIEQGKAKFITSDKIITATDKDVVIIPSGTEHEIINIGTNELKLYTIYSPANHPAETIDKTKLDADYREKFVHLLNLFD